VRRDGASNARGAFDLVQQDRAVDAFERGLAEVARDEDAAAEREGRVAASMRRPSGRAPSPRWITSPARMARPASSSCACGQPK
jgi:hypothetical protein